MATLTFCLLDVISGAVLHIWRDAFICRVPQYAPNEIAAPRPTGNLQHSSKLEEFLWFLLTYQSYWGSVFVSYNIQTADLIKANEHHKVDLIKVGNAWTTQSQWIQFVLREEWSEYKHVTNSHVTYSHVTNNKHPVSLRDIKGYYNQWHNGNKIKR